MMIKMASGQGLRAVSKPRMKAASKGMSHASNHDWSIRRISNDTAIAYYRRSIPQFCIEAVKGTH